MVSKGARSPAGSAAAKKEPPSVTHGSLVVIEHGRTHETTVRCRDPALETRTPPTILEWAGVVEVVGRI